MGEGLWTRFTAGRESLWYYRALVDALASHGKTPVVAELERVVGELEGLARAR